MKSRRFKLASEGIPAGNRRENKGKKPRKESAGRRPEESGFVDYINLPPEKSNLVSQQAQVLSGLIGISCIP
jgi:hypothetical protein